jgi:hypothetical protein
MRFEAPTGVFNLREFHLDHIKARVGERGAAVSLMKLFSYPSGKYLALPPTLFWLFFLLAFFHLEKTEA